MKLKIKTIPRKVLDYHFYPETKFILETFTKIRGMVKGSSLLLKERSMKENFPLISNMERERIFSKMAMSIKVAINIINLTEKVCTFGGTVIFIKDSLGEEIWKAKEDGGLETEMNT